MVPGSKSFIIESCNCTPRPKFCTAPPQRKHLGCDGLGSSVHLLVSSKPEFTHVQSATVSFLGLIFEDPPGCAVGFFVFVFVFLVEAGARPDWNRSDCDETTRLWTMDCPEMDNWVRGLRFSPSHQNRLRPTMPLSLEVA